MKFYAVVFDEAYYVEMKNYPNLEILNEPEFLELNEGGDLW